MTRLYSVNGYAGCVEQRKRANGALVGVYHAEQQGLDPDGGATAWYTVCETHHKCVGHRTLKLARDFAVVPWEWCGVCEPPASTPSH